MLWSPHRDVSQRKYSVYRACGQELRSLVEVNKLLWRDKSVRSKPDFAAAMSAAPDILRALAAELRRQSKQLGPPFAERARKVILAEQYERRAAELERTSATGRRGGARYEPAEQAQRSKH